MLAKAYYRPTKSKEEIEREAREKQEREEKYIKEMNEKERYVINTLEEMIGILKNKHEKLEEKSISIPLKSITLCPFEFITNAKSWFQELHRQGYINSIRYELTGRYGPDHMPTFTVKCSIIICEKRFSCEEQGFTVKEAEDSAAKSLLNSFREKEILANLEIQQIKKITELIAYNEEKLAKYMEKIDLATKIRNKVADLGTKFRDENNTAKHGALKSARTFHRIAVDNLFKALTERNKSIDELSEAKKNSDIAYQTGKLHKEENIDHINVAIEKAKNAKSCKTKSWIAIKEETKPRLIGHS